MLDSEQNPTTATPDAPVTGASPPETADRTTAAGRRRGRASRASGPPDPAPTAGSDAGQSPADAAEPKPARRRRTTKTTAAGAAPAASLPTDATPAQAGSSPQEQSPATAGATRPGVAPVLFQAPEPVVAPAPRRRKTQPAQPEGDATDGAGGPAATEDTSQRQADGAAGRQSAGDPEAGDEASGRSRRRRGRRGRGRAAGDGDPGTETADGTETASGTAGSGGTAGTGADAGGSADGGAGSAPAKAARTRRPAKAATAASGDPAGDPAGASETSRGDAADGGAAPAGPVAPGDGDDPGDAEGGGTGRRRRRRRRRGGSGAGAGSGGDAADGEEPPNTVVHVREGRSRDDSDVRAVKGSTRLEAKRQRRRDGRDSGRRRAPVLTEAEFLARREAVERVMLVRQGEDRTQIGVLEDGVLVEHYVARKDTSSMVGNVYLGKVQNVLPSMEAAFVEIGRGRNGVLYAGEVNYDASMLEGKPARIEQALKSGQSVLVQVTKDPIGHKGARLTSQVSIPGRYMVYVPDGRVSGISRKLPDTERTRLKGILKRLMPEEAGVIIRTAAEGASEADLERDLKRLHAQWEDIAKKAKTASAPSLIYSEPDLVIRVVRDIFNEDFASLIVQGLDEWDTVDNYIRWVAPDLAERAKRWNEDGDVFESYRVDEQLAKALDRKVWLPSGGHLIIDRTEAMIVIDVNTGKFTGKGGTLEQTVTKNNLEAAEEIVRQLRLRDLGGIIVIDFIDMVLESNRELVLRRLTECLGRDRTRHQVAEVTSLGLVQMTRKRVGQGLTEAFSHVCKECGGSGIIIDHDPVAAKRPPRPAVPNRPAAEHTADKAAPDKAAPDKAASGKAASGKAASGKAASGKAASGKTVTERRKVTEAPAEPVAAEVG